LIELLIFLSVNFLESPLIEDPTTELPDFFWGSLDIDAVVRIRSLLVDNRQSVFIGGVEGHLSI
jgi:hypothetical protein